MQDYSRNDVVLKWFLLKKYGKLKFVLLESLYLDVGYQLGLYVAKL